MDVSVVEKRFGHRRVTLAVAQVTTSELSLGEDKAIILPLKEKDKDADAGELQITVNALDFGIEKKNSEKKEEKKDVHWTEELTKQFETLLV